MSPNLPTTHIHAAPALPAADPQIQKRNARQMGAQDCLENRHENPFPSGSALARAWDSGHSETACDDCSGRRVQLACPQCQSDRIRTEDWDYGRSAETGYSDSGQHAHCVACGFADSTDEFEIPCYACNGTGVEPPRNYLAEAFKIAQGDLTITPDRKHVTAIVEYARKMTSAAVMLPETQEVA